MPKDKSALVPSGLRLGYIYIFVWFRTVAMTSRGLKEQDFVEVV